MKKRAAPRIAAGAAVLLLAFSGIPASALSPGQSYVYDAFYQPVYSPDAYTASRVISGATLGTGNFNEPSRVYCDSSDQIYISDTKNNRLIVLHPDLSLKTILTSMRMADGTQTQFNMPRAVFERDGKLYICDTGNNRILICGEDGVVQRQITKPDSEMFSQSLEFSPTDIVVNSSGLLYVSLDGIYQGLAVFSPEGEFDGYYGSNQVQMTFSNMATLLWKKIAPKTMKDNMQRFVPVQYSSLCIDEEDFIIASVSDSSGHERLRKLNPLGHNILAENAFFGDYQSYTYRGTTYSSNLISVSVTQKKYYTALDRRGKKLFQYSEDGDLLTVVGGGGSYAGCFIDPVSVCSQGDRLLVLDSSSGEVTVFTPTAFGEKLHEAIDRYADGLYAESLPYWDDILKMDSAYKLAHMAYGKVNYQLGNFGEAMEYFRKANDREQYSKAKEQYRKEFISQNFTIICVCLAVTFIGLMALIRSGLLRRGLRWLSGIITRLFR